MDISFVISTFLMIILVGVLVTSSKYPKMQEWEIFKPGTRNEKEISLKENELLFFLLKQEIRLFLIGKGVEPLKANNLISELSFSRVILWKIRLALFPF